MLKYYSKLIELGNDKSEVALITLWTKKEIVKKAVNKEYYRFIGQLYSVSVGISGLIRNCLYDKSIRHIVVSGADLSKSGDTLVKLFDNGLDNHKIRSTDIELEKEIPVEKINLVLKNVVLHDLRKEKLSKLDEFLKELNKKKSRSYGQSEIFPEHQITNLQTYPSDYSGFLIKDNYIGNAWLKILKNVMRFGTKKQSSYNIKQKEILNLTTVIYKEDTDNPRIEPYFEFSKTDLEEYYPQVLSPKKINDIEYTYGMRLMNHKGFDQIKIIVNKLKKEQYSRRAIGVTWNVEDDSLGEMSPCLILVQAIIQNNLLFLTGYFRSNDMFEAWPKNAFALRKLQYEISSQLKVKPGSLTIISSSAHIYERHFEAAANILEKNIIKREIHDPRGNIIIYLKNKKIFVQHQSNDGYILAEYSGKSAIELFNKLLDNLVISEMSHAIDIGAELQKAEIALRKGIEYTQDQSLFNT